MRSFLRHVLGPAVMLLIVLTLITGAAYPALITAVAQVAFPSQANGSMIVANGKTVGSSLIGQCFTDQKYFWGRPSAATASSADTCTPSRCARRAMRAGSRSPSTMACRSSATGRARSASADARRSRSSI